MRIFFFILCCFSLGCTNLIYQPSNLTYFEPSKETTGVPETIYVKTPDGPTLHAWFFRADVIEPKGTVIQFHGNAENMTSHFTSLVWVVRYGYNLFTFDYRGYGKSTGAPFPAGVNQDALVAIAKAAELTGNKEKSLIIYGQSLGGAIALRALADTTIPEQIRAAVAESSFLSYKSISREKLSEFWLTWPVQWMAYLLVSNKYGPGRIMDKIKNYPLLVIHGERDPVVPFEHGKNLFEASKAEVKCFWPIETDRHIGLMNLDKGALRTRLIQFLNTSKCPYDSAINL